MFNLNALMEEMRNVVRLEVYRVLRTQARNRVGIVTAYDPKTHMAKVQLQPTGNETGWLQISAHHMGNGFGVMIAPKINDMVEIGHHNGDPMAPRIIGRYHSDVDQPPQIQSGEILMKHDTGSVIYFDQAGNIHIKAAPGKQVLWNGSEASP